MDPILILAGLVLGLLPIQGRIRLTAVVAISLLWAIIGVYESAGGPGNFILAVIVAAANLGIGVAVGTIVGLFIEGRRPSSRAR